jgi:hypothetical protein
MVTYSDKSYTFYGPIALQNSEPSLTKSPLPLLCHIHKRKYSGGVIDCSELVGSQSHSVPLDVKCVSLRIKRVLKGITKQTTQFFTGGI